VIITSSNQNSRINQDDLERARLLTKTAEIASAYLDEIDDRPAATDYTPKPLLSLPTDGAGAESTLDLFLQRYGSDLPASNGPRFWGFVTGGTTPASLIGDWLTSVYDLNLTAAANSNAPDIEFEAIGMLRKLFHLPKQFNGTFVTGATMANFAGLAMGREWVSRQRGESVAENGLHSVGPIRVLGGEVHSSILKAMSMLGMGRRNYVPVATLPGSREAVDIERQNGRSPRA
jgi:glutamate/tyrosine decarboxylase-like PLP-dependent enzyme